MKHEVIRLEKSDAARPDAKTLLAHAAANALAIVREILREIFDEAAYSRFLSRTRSVSCRKSYADFLRENELAKARRPRCC